MQNPGSNAGVFVAALAHRYGSLSRDVTADTAIRLGRYFGTDPRFWPNLQAAHDLSKAEKAHSYKKIVPRKAA
jgi:plasmid maintenance system antidote protein VapI